MIRIVAFLAVLGGAGVLVANLALREGADAHPSATKTPEVTQAADAPPPAKRGIRVVQAAQVASRAADENSGAKGERPAPAVPAASERNFLTRVGTPRGAQNPSRVPASEGAVAPLAAPAGEDKPASKLLADRAPLLPASVDAKAYQPVAPLRGSSSALAPSGESTAAPARPGDGAGLRLNLNTASADELDRLSGGGLIGKAIVRGRPYASSEDLVRKRVIGRATFERIKNQVAVP